MKTVQVILSTLAATSLIVGQVAAHGHMTQPKGRTSESYGDPQDKYACDSDKTGTVTSYASGEEIEVEWTRNNHIGGFIRYSIAPKNAVSKATFDANAFFYTCRESNCSLKQCKDKYCGDDAGSKDDEIKCRAKIKLPDYLEKGDYVLQWTWHAAGSSYGNIGWSTSNFKTCADIRLTSSGVGKKPTCPTFVGGDRVTFMDKTMDDAKKTSQCFYFDDNGLGKDIVKYSDSEGYKRYMFGIPKEVEKCGGSASSPVAGNSTAPATTTKAPSSVAPPGASPKPSTEKPLTSRPASTRTGRPATRSPAPSTAKPTTAPPAPETEAPTNGDDDNGDGDDTGNDSDGDNTDKDSDTGDDTPGTVAPWKQVAPNGGRHSGSGRGRRDHSSYDFTQRED